MGKVSCETLANLIMGRHPRQTPQTRDDFLSEFILMGLDSGLVTQSLGVRWHSSRRRLSDDEGRSTEGVGRGNLWRRSKMMS